MRIKNKILIIVASAIMFIPSGCNTDILYLEPYGSLSNDVVFNSVDDFETALMGVYSGLRSGSYYGKNFVVLADLLTDNTYAKTGFTNAYGYVHTWNIQPGTSEFESFFAAAYRVITRASNVINYSESFVPNPNTQEERDRLKQIRGEAFLARAIAHFDLLRVYAPRFNAATATTDLGVPVITVSEVGAPARATVAQVYTQIFADITSAKERLAIASWTNKGRFTPVVIEALLSRIYLYRGEWEQSIVASNNVINAISADNLINNQTALKSMYANDAGSEIIFHLVIASLTENPGSIGTEYIGPQPGVRISPNYLVTPELAALYDPFNDIRFLAFIKTNVLLVGTNIRGITCEKYPGRSDLSRGVNSAKVFMLAEIFLNKAEAHAMKGSEDNLANQALNTLLSKRILGYTDQNLSGSALIDAIRLERRKELAFDGHYWLDLKRWNLGFQRFANPLSNFPNDLIISAGDYRWLWPIPQHEMNTNNNMKQNLGY